MRDNLNLNLMTEFIKALFANATERIKNPLIGTFFMSWIVFNWKAILFLLFSVNDIETKLTILSDKYYNLGNLIFYPLLVALGYIFLLPYITLGIDFLLKHSNNKQSERIQKNKLISIDSQITIALKNIDLEQKQTEYRERRNINVNIEVLNKTIQELQNDLSSERTSFSNSITELNEVKDDLTKTIKDYYTQFTQVKYLINSIKSRLKTFKFEESIELISLNNIETEITKILKILNESENYTDIIDVKRIGRDIDKDVILEQSIKKGVSDSMNLIGRITKRTD